MIDEVIGIIEKLLSVEGVELARRATKKASPKSVSVRIIDSEDVA